MVWFSRTKKYRFRVKAHKMPDMHKDVPIIIEIRANNDYHAMMIAAEIGFNHHMLLTLIE